MSICQSTFINKNRVKSSVVSESQKQAACSRLQTDDCKLKTPFMWPSSWLATAERDGYFAICPLTRSNPGEDKVNARQQPRQTRCPAPILRCERRELSGSRWDIQDGIDLHAARPSYSAQPRLSRDVFYDIGYHFKDSVDF